MANVDRPNGFKPSKSLIGSPWNALIRTYAAGDRSGDATQNHGDIYIGDPVKLVSGKVFPADSGDTILGVVVAVGKKATNAFGEAGFFNQDNLMQRYLAYDEDGIVGVVPAEYVLFEVQTASDLDLVEGASADITSAASTAHGSRVTGKSTVELTTASNVDVYVVENNTTPSNDVTTTNARHLVRFANTNGSISVVTGVQSITGGTGITITGTASDPIINAD